MPAIGEHLSCWTQQESYWCLQGRLRQFQGCWDRTALGNFEDCWASKDNCSRSALNPEGGFRLHSSQFEVEAPAGSSHSGQDQTICEFLSFGYEHWYSTNLSFFSLTCDYRSQTMITYSILYLFYSCPWNFGKLTHHHLTQYWILNC